jgi:hypothetical protein
VVILLGTGVGVIAAEHIALFLPVTGMCLAGVLRRSPKVQEPVYPHIVASRPVLDNGFFDRYSGRHIRSETVGDIVVGDVVSRWEQGIYRIWLINL